MSKFSEFWGSKEGKLGKRLVLSALRNGETIPQFPFCKEKTLLQDEDDSYFERLEDLRGIEISDEQFEKCDFTYLNLSFTKFVNCRFLDVNFFSSRIHKAQFVNCEFLSCRLDGIYGVEVEFKNDTFSQVSFGSALLIEISLEHVNIINSELRSARLISPILIDTNISSSDFSRSLISPTESLIKEIKKNKDTLILDNIKWLSPEGNAIRDPLVRSRIFNIFRS